MLSRLTSSIQRNVGTFLVVLAVLVGGVWATTKTTTDYLLHENATTTAYWWARYLAANVTDLEQIASGELPSTASMTFLEGTHRLSRVFRYVVYNRAGYPQLVSDRNGTTLVDHADFSAEALQAIKTGQPVIDAKTGVAPLPVYFAEAYIPVLANDRPIAVVAAYIDETAQRDMFNKTFLAAAATLCTLVLLAFAVPAVAWYRRTREKQLADNRIRHLAHHDALTGLANRPHLFEWLDRALADMRAGGRSVAVHFVDLDYFKEVNDTLGHDAGDFLLKTISERLQATVRQGDFIARLGGDEFIVVQADVSGMEAAEKFARRLTAALTAPIPFNNSQILPTASVGVAVAPQDGRYSDALLKSADLALYRSKADGRNCFRMFSPEMNNEVDARNELEQAIREAVLGETLEIDYRPLFSRPDGKLIGYEAVPMLPRPDGSRLPPELFMPIAEEMRIGGRIGSWVMRESCKFAATWPPGLTLAGRLRQAQFGTGSISEAIGEAIRESGLDPHCLELEVTEALLLSDRGSILPELRALKAMGVSVVLDEFGAGYSSLAYLWRFPFDKVTIDRRFTESLEGAGRDAESAAKSLIALARQLHMRVAVEADQGAPLPDSLAQTRPESLEAFFFGDPVPATEVAAQILAHCRPGGQPPPPQQHVARGS